MTRLRRSLLLLAVSALCLAQSASELTTPPIRRVGDKLACLCGRCKNTVATCQMLGCGYATPARQQIAQMQTIGANDENIIGKFITKEGRRALAVPPAEGFQLLSWTMPFVAIAIGLMAIWAWMRRERRVATAPAAPLDPAVLEKYRERIDQDLAKLD